MTPPVRLARAGLVALPMFFLVAGSVQGAGLLLGVSGWGAVVVGVGSVMAGSLASRSLLRALWARS